MNTNTASGFTMADLLNAKRRLSELSSPAGSVPRIVEAWNMVEQFRFPRTKKRRIRNKWKKRSENFRPMRGGFWDKLNNVYYCHPSAKAELLRKLHSQNIEDVDASRPATSTKHDND